MPTPRLRDSIDCSFILSIYGKAKITQFAYVIGIMTYVLTILNYDSQLLTLLFFFIFIAFLIAAITIFFSVYVIHEPSLIFKMELFSVIVTVSVGCTIIVIETFDPVLFKEFTESYKTKSNSSLVNKVHNFRSAIIGTLFVAITQLVMLLIKYWESTSDQGTLKKISKFFSSISMPSFENLGNLPSSAIGSHRNGQPEENQEIGAIALRNLISVSSGASSSSIQISTEPPDSVINLEEDMTVQSACSAGSFGDESGGAGTSGVVTV